ncbi:hypothetical protein [Pseudoflavitalea rhizosphaerae]|uniref:hypothetical protein n=1 Tax=Pseudoflavitalea rhizosphaerae TaxID=1884793 RepID=UPI000F8F02DA|nr:hypothetical protein [Pseudoflavitalea rhizosphaerae]
MSYKSTDKIELTKFISLWPKKRRVAGRSGGWPKMQRVATRSPLASEFYSVASGDTVLAGGEQI